MADEPLNSSGDLRLSNRSSTTVLLEFQPSLDDWRYRYPDGKEDAPWKPLALFDSASKTIHTYPLRTSPSFSILNPKYPPLNTIAFSGLSVELPSNENEIETALSILPEHFYTQPLFGLGIKASYRPLLDALRRKNIRSLTISWTNKTSFDGNKLTLDHWDFEQVAYELDRITKRFSKQSRDERLRHAHNELLAKHFVERFSRDDTPYERGMIVSLLRRARKSEVGISNADRIALADQVASEAPAIAKQ